MSSAFQEHANIWQWFMSVHLPSLVKDCNALLSEVYVLSSMHMTGSTLEKAPIAAGLKICIRENENQCVLALCQSVTLVYLLPTM